MGLNFLTSESEGVVYIKELWTQPRSQVLSPTRRETLVRSGHVSPRIWEITNKRFGGGAEKCEIVSTKRRRRDQWKLCIRPCLKGPVFYSFRTSQDKF